MEEFAIRGEWIELIKLLKAAGLAGSGGEARHFVEEGLVQVNGSVEDRKRRKLRAGDMVLFDGRSIVITRQDTGAAP